MFSNLLGFLFAALSFVQVPQWDNDWTKCSVAVPDTACHWYVVNPDNTFGKGFSWSPHLNSTSRHSATSASSTK